MRPDMVSRIGVPAMLELLAEESAELAKAALKTARVWRGENPTPVRIIDAYQALVEEFTDTVQCAEELRLTADREQMERKRRRFEERWRGAGR